MIDFAFTPARLSVHAGDTVSWVNTGASPHTVTASGGAAFGTPMLAAGATYRTVLRSVGTFSYVCAFHPQMRGVVDVRPASAALPAPVAAAPAPAAIGPSAAAGSDGAAPAALGASPPGAGSPSSAPDVRSVAATSMWESPIVAWTFWGGIALVAFLSVAWWRGREPV